jgi:signal transduction histidine kinase
MVDGLTALAASSLVGRPARAAGASPSHSRFVPARERVPGPRWYAVLWSLLLAVSAVLVFTPDVSIAGPNPLLAVAVATTAAAVGLALLQLGALRFSAFGHPLDLCAGLAFGTLAASNLVVRVAGPVAGTAPATLETGLYLVLLTRATAAALFLVGLFGADTVIDPRARPRFGWRLGASVALVIVAGVTAILAAGSNLPSAVSAHTRQLLEAGALVVDALPGQEPWLLLADGAVALLLLLATAGYVRLSWRLGDPDVASLALALTLLFFSQFHSLLFPPVVGDYVSTADGFRLAAYLVLLLGLVSRIAGEITEGASREERLRLSRELHDGLAQQLALLNLRLIRATAPDRPPEWRARDLGAAQRLVEAALSEARQAITALRTGAVSWEDFTRTVAAFADEFETNHEVDIRLLTQATGGTLPLLEAELQMDVVRILHEACANALRHGAATQIEVALAARREWLDVRIRDDGRGFDPDQAQGGAGVGLRSLHERLARRGGTLVVLSAPGQGATVRARVPLPSHWVPQP